MLFFNVRKKIADAYSDWAEKNSVKDCAESVIGFLVLNNLMDEEAALKFANITGTDQNRTRTAGAD